jgi:hypothetical protein
MLQKFLLKVKKKNFLFTISILKMSSNSPANEITIKNKIKSPPNILILTEEDDSFQFLKRFLHSILGRNSYTIYNLSNRDFIENSIWMANCCLFINTENLENGDRISQFINFMTKGGRIFSLPSPSLSLNEKFDRLNIEDSTNISYLKSDYDFEAIYSQRKFEKNIFNLNNPNLDAKNLIYSYESNEFNGRHYVSKISLNSNSDQSKKYLADLYSDILDRYFGIKYKYPDNSKFERDNLEKYVVFSKNEVNFFYT